MFTFSLQALLDYRKSREEERQMELAAAIRALAEETRKLEGIIADERGNLAELVRMAGEARPVSQVAALLIRGQQLGERRRSQEENLERAKKSMEECRDRVIEARQEREKLEKLKEKRIKAYIAEEARRETKMIDEAARSAAYTREKR